MTDAVAVFVSAGSEDEAVRIGRALVEERLAACANVIPRVRSIYRWQGRVEESPEAYMVLKTAGWRVEALTARIRELHSYEVPAIVAVPIAHGLEAYLAWIRENTDPAG